MLFELRIGTTEFRCVNCGRIIRGDPIIIKTCCVNKPWVFCSAECYRQFLMKWVRNQEAGTGGRLRRDIY